MRKLFCLISLIICLQQLQAQSPPPIRGGNIDKETEAAIKMTERKMIEVLKMGNGFKDATVTKTKGKYIPTAFYRNTNGADGIIYAYSSDNTSMNTSFLGYFIHGDIRKKYFEVGAEKSDLGLPVSDLTNIRSGANQYFGLYSTFENGAICKAANTPSCVITGLIYQKYKNMGGPTSQMGFAISNYASFLGRTNQYFQTFQGGSFWGNGKTAYMMHGDILKKWNVSTYGLPLEDIKGNSVFSMESQRFEKGTIISGTKTGAWLVKDPILNKWNELGGVAGICGLPISEEATNGSITAQNFEKGLMLLVNGKVSFVADDNEKNKTDNNKIRQKIRIPGKQ